MKARCSPTPLPAGERSEATGGLRSGNPGLDFSRVPILPRSDVARGGASGTGGPLPHFRQIQRSFGPRHDLSTIRAHVGGAAAEASARLGAAGYATGDDVAFRTAPSVRLAAHEAAHVVQQRAGSNVLGRPESHEAVANRVADRVAAGRSAADLLPATSGAGRPSTHAGAPVQLSPDDGADKETTRVRELAKWPADALSAWKHLGHTTRAGVVLQMAALYGADFAKQFLAIASKPKHGQPVSHYYGPGVSEVLHITAESLMRRGYRLAQKDSVHEWWVHPTGESVVRRWNAGQKTTESPEPASPPQPARSERCRDVDQLTTSICDNASRICALAKDLGDDPSANDTCERAKRSCEGAHTRSEQCDQAPLPDS